MVHENGCWSSFLDSQPVTEGHTLVVPKRHAERFQDLNREEVESFGHAMEETVRLLTKAYGEGINIYSTSGKGTSTSVPHFHVHVIPRRAGDRLWEHGRDQSRIVLDRSSGFPRLPVTGEELRRIAVKITGEGGD